MATFVCDDAAAMACLLAGLAVVPNTGLARGRYRVSLPTWTGGRWAKKLACHVHVQAMDKKFGRLSGSCPTCGKGWERAGWSPRTVEEAVAGVRAAMEVAQATFPSRGPVRTPADPASRNTARKLRRKKLSRGLKAVRQ